MSKIIANTIENVAGTETHDVATMGIERGSNANGDYTKFPDGTMICKVAIIVPATSTVSGALYTSLTTPSWTFPIPFIERPSVSGSSSGSTYTWVNCQTSGNTTVIIRPWRNSSSASELTFDMIAIGRWK